MASGGLLEFTRIFMQRVAKPLSGAIGNYAKTHPRFRRRCVMTGNITNYYYVRFTHYNAMRTTNTTTKFQIKALSEERAADLGAEIIAESILTMIPVTFGIITMNHIRKEDKKMRTVQSNIDTISEQYSTLSALLEEMQSELVRLQGLMEHQLNSEYEGQETVAEEVLDSQIEASVLAELDDRQSVSKQSSEYDDVLKEKKLVSIATDSESDEALMSAVPVPSS